MRTRKLLLCFNQNVRTRIHYNVAQEYTNGYFDFTNVLVVTLVIILIQQLVSTHSVTIYTGSKASILSSSPSSSTSYAFIS